MNLVEHGFLLLERLSCVKWNRKVYVNNYPVTVIRKDHVVQMAKVESLQRLYFLLPRVDRINSAEVKITGKPIKDGTGMGMQVPYKIKSTSCKALLAKLKDVLKQLY